MKKMKDLINQLCFFYQDKGQFLQKLKNSNNNKKVKGNLLIIFNKNNNYNG